MDVGLRVRWVMVGVALAALAAMLLAPQTRWLVRTQAAMQLPGSGEWMALLGRQATSGVPPDAPRRRALERRVQEHPEDFALQVAYVIRSAPRRATDPVVVQALRDLVPRFPQRASLRAMILRLA